MIWVWLLLFYGGIASGVMMAGIAGQGPAGLMAYLFGALTAVSKTDLWVIAGLAAVILIFTVGLWPRLFAICADEDFARVLGLRVKWLNLLVVIVASVTVTVSMRTVGLLLISALMVIPVAAAQQVFVSFRTTLYGAMAIGTVAALGGTIDSYYWDTASGATIVMMAIALLGLAVVAGLLVQPFHRFIRYASARDIRDPRTPPSQPTFR
ncbi:MAG: metal ABC transporter permease [Propionibacteriaceae bacterium]|nr:metal ABC transporter permease [Propionibacteriaceae bacterium]